jgi:hypothetical protein
VKFTRKFIDQEYRIHCENILFDTEKTLLPATHPYELEMEKLREYINSCFEETSFTYKSKKYSLNRYMIVN